MLAASVGRRQHAQASCGRGSQHTSAACCRLSIAPCPQALCRPLLRAWHSSFRCPPDDLRDGILAETVRAGLDLDVGLLAGLAREVQMMNIGARPADRDSCDGMHNSSKFIKTEAIMFETSVPLDMIGVDCRSAQCEIGDCRAEDKDATAEHHVARPLSLPT